MFLWSVLDHSKSGPRIMQPWAISQLCKRKEQQGPHNWPLTCARGKICTLSQRISAFAVLLEWCCFQLVESTGSHPEQFSFLQALGTWPLIQRQQLLWHAGKENVQESACAYGWHVGTEVKWPVLHVFPLLDQPLCLKYSLNRKRTSSAAETNVNSWEGLTWLWRSQAS